MPTFAIGDIHGSLTALKTIFDQGIIKENDQVIFLGDYIDRGPDSKGVIDWFLENRKRYQFEFIKGNHEIMMLTARTSPERLMEWLQFGGAETLDSYGIGDDSDWEFKIDPVHWDFFENCLPYYEVGNIIFVHAGLEIGVPLNKQNKHHLFWKKYKTPESYLKGKKVICGHTSRKNGEIANFNHTICLDTYAYGGMWLSCLNVDTNEYIQANEYGMVELGKL